MVKITSLDIDTEKTMTYLKSLYAIRNKINEIINKFNAVLVHGRDFIGILNMPDSLLTLSTQRTATDEEKDFMLSLDYNTTFYIYNEKLGRCVITNLIICEPEIDEDGIYLSFSSDSPARFYYNKENNTIELVLE